MAPQPRSFYDFEAMADERMRGLDLWRKPLRSVLSYLYLAADVEYTGGRFGGVRPVDAAKGGTILSRASQLIPFLAGCDRQVGINLEDALGALSQSDVGGVVDALLYAHFCELVPFVRNEYMRVEDQGDGFRLTYPTVASASFEERDVVASELSLTVMDRAPFDVPALTRMLERWPKFSLADLLPVLRDAHAHYMGAIVEDAFVGEAHYRDAFGFERADYVRVRAAMMALASWCIGMAAASEAKSFPAGGAADKWRNECLEWSAPLLSRPFVEGLLQAVSGVSGEALDRVLPFFVDPVLEGQVVSGEGYLAPMVALGDAVLFSPRALLTMTGERNLLYVINRRDARRFNELVSAHLEPTLLLAAERILRSVPGLCVERNVIWQRGEIDLLAYDPGTDTALQVQAKAPIPPQGARMTRQIESNTLKGVEQLRSFEDADTSEMRGVLRRAFGVKAPGTRWTSAILARSSFGTSRAWDAIGGRGALNLFLLRNVVGRLSTEGSIDLTQVPGAASKIMDEAVAASSAGWREESFDLFGRRITFPNLKLDTDALGRAVAALTPG